MEISSWFGAIPPMGLMTMTSMMTKSCSPAMTVVTIRFENRIPVAHSVVPNSSMTMMMMMMMITNNLRHVAGVHQVVGRVALLQGAPAVALVVRPVVHLVVLEAAHPVEVLAVVARPVEVLAVVARPVEVLAVVLLVEVLAVVLLVEVPAVVLPVGVLAVVPQAVVKVALPSERALLGD